MRTAQATETITCTSCRRTKPVRGNFYQHRTLTVKSGLVGYYRHQCRVCVSARALARHYASRPKRMGVEA